MEMGKKFRRSAMFWVMHPIRMRESGVNASGNRLTRSKFTGLLPGIVLALTAGCAANTGIVQVEPDIYMIYREDGAGIFGNPEKMKGVVINEAAAFAARQGKIAIEVSTRQTPVGFGPGQWASIEYRFRLVSPNESSVVGTAPSGADALTPPPPVKSSQPVARGSGTAFATINTRSLVTAYHVIQGAERIEVSCGQRKFVPAVLEKIDPANDLALLTVQEGAPAFLDLAPEGSARTGQRVFTLGFPVPEVLGTEPKYSEGSISSTTGLGGASNLLQVTVPIQPGNSGGPLLDTNGKVVGIITSSAAVSAFLRVTGTLPQNVNWAVSGEYLRPLVRSIGKTGGAPPASPVDRAKASVCLLLAFG